MIYLNGQGHKTCINNLITFNLNYRLIGQQMDCLVYALATCSPVADNPLSVWRRFALQAIFDDCSCYVLERKLGI